MGNRGCCQGTCWSGSPEGRVGLPCSLLSVPWCLPGGGVQWACVGMDPQAGWYGDTGTAETALED